MSETTSQEETQNQRRIIDINFTASTFTNTTKYSLLFSLKRKRFIKPVLEKHLNVYYKVYEGYYLLLSRAGYYNAPVYVYKIHLYLDDKGNPKKDIIAEAVWEKLEGWNKDEQCPELIKDFIKAEPKYHKYPIVSYDKIYPEEEIQKVLKGGICGHAEE